jgi:hypothetical protein
MVYEVTENYSYRTFQGLGKDKESAIKGVQKSKVRIIVHHQDQRDQTGTNKVYMGF